MLDDSWSVPNPELMVDKECPVPIHWEITRARLIYNINNFIERFKKVTKERDEAHRIKRESMGYLILLTPSGSEFHDDPKRCYDFIRERLDSNHRNLVNKIKQNKELVEQLNVLKAENEYLREKIAHLAEKTR